MANKKIPTFEEIRELFQEVGDKQKENAIQLKELRDATKENSAQIKELRDASKASDARVDKLSKNLGGLSNKWGNLGEAMTIGESTAVFNEIDGIEVDNLLPSFTYNYKGKEHEIDGLAVGKDMVIVIEAKATMKQTDIKDFIKHKLTLFTKLVPAFEDKKIYGAMGFLSASDAVQTFAQEQGLLLILPIETNKAIVSFPKGFKLRNFHP